MSYVKPGYKKHVMITGGCGFIGSHLVRRFIHEHPDYYIVNVDALTYCGNIENLKDIEEVPNYRFILGDITNKAMMEAVFSTYEITDVIHLAAESHVDNSLKNPFIFAQTNVIGTLTLLYCAYEYWRKKNILETSVFYHVSTDEVYGALQDDGTLFTEKTPYDPHSPYSASKASSDHFVRAYHDSYGLNTRISNCSNNYGSYQFPEKLIPKTILRIKDSKPIPVYGKGLNTRDWLSVKDHCAAIDLIFHKGKNGETYNIGGNNEMKNIDLVKLLIKITDKFLEREEGCSDNLIIFVQDRAGHDLRYAIDSSKLQNELGWKPEDQNGFEDTVKWYLENEQWIKNLEGRQF